MMKLLKILAEDERGAVAVDWIVLTAGLVGIGVTLASTLDAGIQSAIGNIFTSIDSLIGPAEE